MERTRRVLVVGATGGTGRATVERLLGAGHLVTAFARSADDLGIRSERLTTVRGDATNPDDVQRAMEGQDAVIVTLGISENPLRVRLLGTKRTPMDVRSVGTRNVIRAMRAHGVRRLVAQSSFGVGETRRGLRLLDRLLFSLLLAPQIADTEAQEELVRGSDLEWVLAQPVHLTDGDGADMPFTSTEGEVRGWKVSRRGVARFLAEAIQSCGCTGRSVALSGGAA